MTEEVVRGEEFGGRVAILLATFDGARFLEEQLQSFEAQTHENWRVWASDDGSRDQTLDVLNSWAAKFAAGRTSIFHGPGEGFAANFQSLIGNQNIRADYFAFSDQDDVWMGDKLERALACLRFIDPAVPAIYCSRTEMIDHIGARIGVLSPLFSRPPSFANALVQSIAGGNTMVLNRAARELMARFSTLRPVSHDWWAYQLVTGVGGRVIYDAQPSIYYRQHDANIVGGNHDWTARIRRFHIVIRGRFAAWNDINTSCLARARPALTRESIGLLDEFEAVRSAGPVKRVVSAFNNRLYRQTILGNIGMSAAFMMGKF